MTWRVIQMMRMIRTHTKQWMLMVKHSTTICKLVDLNLALHQSDCRIPNWVSAKTVLSYRNWPRYGLCWSGWYFNPEQHELCQPSRGRAGRHNECCSGLQYQPRQRRPYKWSISILPRSQFTKSKGNLRFRRLVPLFVPIGVCVTTHDDGTASDVTIGMWRHNQQVTNHERNGKPWFSLPT